jgi:hypothetical protein
MCVLHVAGKNFDLGALAESSELEPYRVHRAGEVRNPRKPGGRTWTTSGFSVTVSDAAWSDFRQQTRDACAFLDRHRSELQRLRDLGTIDDIRLDFPVYLRMGDGVLTQCELFPPELVERAGALGMGLELSLYFPPDEDQEEGRVEQEPG